MLSSKTAITTLILIALLIALGFYAFGDALELTDFTQINENGFGNSTQSYAWSMTWFKGKLYVGTGPIDPEIVLEYVRQVTEEFFSLDLRGEIWQYTPETGEWKLVHQSEEHEIKVYDITGETAVDQGYRAMVVHDGALYVVSNVWIGGPARFLVSEDGEHFEAFEMHPGMLIPSDIILSSIRSLVSFRGKLYTTPCNTARESDPESGFNIVISELPVVFESVELDWQEKVFRFQPVSDVSLRSRSIGRTRRPKISANLNIFEMAAFDNYLYIGASNMRGFQIWKSDCLGGPPYDWRIAVEEGAGYWRNHVVVSMYPFRGSLYVGGGSLTAGFDWTSAAELIRIWPDDDYDLICGGSSREPLSSMSAGFGNKYNANFRALAEYDGFLYVGTSDRSWLSDTLPPNQGFDLYRSQDGINWGVVNIDGLGNPLNYVCRNLVSTPDGLFLGTGNVELGAEIWLGKKDK